MQWIFGWEAGVKAAGCLCPKVAPHLNVAESPHVVGTWRQVHSQLRLIGPLAVIGCFNLQLQHIVSTN